MWEFRDFNLEDAPDCVIPLGTPLGWWSPRPRLADPLGVLDDREQLPFRVESAQIFR